MCRSDFHVGKIDKNVDECNALREHECFENADKDFLFVRFGDRYEFDIGNINGVISLADLLDSNVNIDEDIVVQDSTVHHNPLLTQSDDMSLDYMDDSTTVTYHSHHHSHFVADKSNSSIHARPNTPDYLLNADSDLSVVTQIQTQGKGE